MTTKKQFDLFVSECRRWIDFWGLADWEIVISHEEIDTESRGRCYTDLTGKIATVILNKKPRIDQTDQEIKRVAFHEICHILTGALCCCASSRFCSFAEIQEADHDIVRRLENCVFERLTNG